MKEIYKKFNSFVGLRIRNKFNIQNVLDNLQLHLNDKKNSLNLSQNEIQILEYIKKDLFESGTKKKT